MEMESDGISYIRKGPWSAEEDEVLIKYVNKYGPKGWSSIRSMGLLPRTGKSCRLRWVNKLRPNLKTGCKFSAEEERLVIELQAQFGNKWAKIATHLQGRTDNDVKNFWSARRKRLDRVLHKPAFKSHKISKGKDPVILYEMPMVEVPPCNYVPMEQGSSSSHEDQLKHPSFSGNSEESGMFPFQETTGLLPIPDMAPIQTISFEGHSLDCPVSMLPLPLLQVDLPVLPGCQDVAPEPADIDFMSMFNHQEPSESESKAKLSTRLPPTQIGKKEDIRNPATPERFFDEFPPDMFDFLESLPNSSLW